MNVFGKDWGCGHKNEKNDDEIQWWDWLIRDGVDTISSLQRNVHNHAIQTKEGGTPINYIFFLGSVVSMATSGTKNPSLPSMGAM